jgi:hypothetical protein
VPTVSATGQLVLAGAAQIATAANKRAHPLADTARTVAELVDEGSRVFVDCVAAENRTPAVAAAYLIARGAERQAAIERVAAALGSMPRPFLVNALARD